MTNLLYSNKYLLDLETLKIVTHDNEIIKEKIIDGDRYVTLDWIFGVKDYKLDFVVWVSSINHTYPIDVLKELKIMHKDDNKENCYLTNLYISFKKPIESLRYPGYFYIPYYSRYLISRDGEVIRIEDEKKLSKLTRNYAPDDVKNRTGGYIYYNAVSDIGINIMYRHRSIALTFLDYSIDPTKLVVNHKNGIPGDDRLDNLELVTKAENNRHAIESGLCPNSTIKLEYYNWKTGDKIKFMSISSAASELGMDYNKVAKRLRQPTKKYADGHCFKPDDGTPWALDDKLFTMGVELAIVGKNVLTGEIIIADSGEAMSRLTGINPTSIRAAAFNGDYKLVKQYMFKYADDDNNFPDVDFNVLQKLKNKY